MASVFYNNGKAALLKNDMDGVTLRLAYMAPAYTPDVDAHVYFSDVSASVASGSPTETLASVTITVDNTNNRVEVDAADPTENNVTTSTDKFVIYIWTGSAATSELLCCIDIAEGTLSPVDGTLSITFNAEGIFAI
jgi:hypothetical protein